MNAPNLHLNLLRPDEKTSSSPIRLRVMLPIFSLLFCAACAIWWGILFMQGLLLNGKEMSKLVQYDRIELIKPEHHDELLADLKGRTGLEITRVDIGSIDFLRDMAMLKIYYKNPGVGASDDAVNHQSKITRQEWEEVNGL